jgi:hypothetical protein
MGLTDNQRYAAKYFLDQGYQPHIVAGLIGNFTAESGAQMDPGAFNPNENAIGIAQWTPAGGRRAAVEEYMRTLPMPAHTLPAQLSAVDWELKGNESAAMKRALAAVSPAEAASLLDQHYERSSGEHREKRMQVANDVYRWMGEEGLADVDLATLAHTSGNGAWPTNPMANIAMSGNPQSGPTDYRMAGIMSPQEDEKSSLHPTLGLQSLGAAIAAGSMGESAASDLAALRKNYFGERETEATRQQEEQQRAAMGPVFEKHPDLFAAWKAGAPVEQLIGIAAARENMTWQSGEGAIDREFKAGENALDRGLSEREMEERSRLTEMGYGLDQQKIDETKRMNDASIDQWGEEFKLEKEKEGRIGTQWEKEFQANQEQRKIENENWLNQFNLETQKYAEAVETTQHQGIAARDLMARTAERLGDKGLANRFREMPANAFSDPSMVNQFTELMTSPFKDGKEGRTSAMKNYETYLQIKETDPEQAEQFYNNFVKTRSSGTSQLDIEKFKVGADSVKADRERISGLQNQRMAVDQMLMHLDQGTVMTGPINEMLMPFKQAFVELGLVDPDSNEWLGGVASTEQFEALANKIFPTLRQAGSGAMSDFDAQTLKDAFANLGKTPEGNRMVLQAFKAMGAREEAYITAKEAWLYEKGSLEGFDTDFKARVQSGDPSVGPPMFFSEEQFGKDDTSKANLRAHVQAGNLKPGMTFYMKDEDGKTVPVKIKDQAELDMIVNGLGME